MVKQCNACGKYVDSYVVGRVHIQTATGLLPFTVCYCVTCVERMSANLNKPKEKQVIELESDSAWETPNWDSD